MAVGLAIWTLPNLARAQYHDGNWTVVAPFRYDLGVAAATGAEGATGDSATGAADLTLDGDADLTVGYGNFSSELAAGGRLLAGHGTGPALGSELWFYLRPYELGMCRFEIDYHLDWQIVPRLSSRRELWRRPYTREQWGGAVTMAHYQLDRWGFELGRVTLHFADSQQVDGGLSRRRFELIDDWTLFSLRRRPSDPDRPMMAVDLGVLASTGIEDADDVAVATAYPLRASHVPIGSTGWELDGALAWSFTVWMQTSGVGGSHYFGSSTLPDKTVVTGNFGVRGAIGPTELSAGYQRSLYLTFDTELAREDRLSAQLSFPLRRADLTLEGFAADTEVWVERDRSERSRTGGGRVAIAYPLAGGWDLGLSGELARGFYGPLDRDARPRAELGFRGRASLSRRFDRVVDLVR